MSKIENHKESANTKASQQNKPRRVRRERRALDFGHSPQAPPPSLIYLTPHSLERAKAPVPHDEDNTPQRHFTS